jgi:hypothetical protein
MNGHCIVDNQSYRHTLRTRNTSCFSKAINVTRKRLNIKIISTLPLLSVWSIISASVYMYYYSASDHSSSILQFSHKVNYGLITRHTVFLDRLTVLLAKTHVIPPSIPCYETGRFITVFTIGRPKTSTQSHITQRTTPPFNLRSILISSS